MDVGFDIELCVNVGFVCLCCGFECEMCLLVEHCLRCVWMSVPVVVGGLVSLANLVIVAFECEVCSLFGVYVCFELKFRR